MTREQEIAYAGEHGIEVPVKSGAAYSIDQNLWGRSIEAGPLEDPWIAPPEEAFALTIAPERGAGRAAGGRDRVRAGRAGRDRRRGSSPLAGADPAGGRDRRRARRGPDRHDREPAGRASRAARSTRCRPRRCCWPPTRGVEELVARARPRPHQAAARPRSTRRWSTTASGSRRCGRRCRRSWPRPTRAGHGEARVKLYRGGCTGGRAQRAPARCTTTAGHLRGGRRLPARRGGRVHPRLVACRPRLGGGRRAQPTTVGV